MKSLKIYTEIREKIKIWKYTWKLFEYLRRISTKTGKVVNELKFIKYLMSTSKIHNKCFLCILKIEENKI